MEENNKTNATVEAPVLAANDAVQPAVDAAPKKRSSRSRKKVVAPVVEEQKAPVEKEEPKATSPRESKRVENEAPQATSAPADNASESATPAAPAPAAPAPVTSAPVENKQRPEPKPLPKMPSNLVIRDFCDLANSGSRIPLLSDQQIQQLTYEDACQRNLILEAILCNVLDYDIVLSDTNIWLELLIGHTSSHSDPRVNARLMFERQLEFISRMMKRIGGKFMIMSETYEEVDRFATQQEPTNYKDADWKDEALCRNVAARLAKRLMLSQQKENRLRIEGIGSESHHAAFADPAIIRRTVELFAQGKKVLLLTNDASVGIRSLGMCDDLQRTNNVDDTTWRTVYEPQRPMVLTMDDLKLLDQYTRQYHFTQVAAGRGWMQDVQMRTPVTIDTPLELWLEGFRPGDRHESRSARQEQQRREEQQRKDKEQQRLEQERREAERKEQQRLEQERREAEKAARREEQERREAEKAARREEQQRREAERRAERERKAQEKNAQRAASEEAAARSAETADRSQEVIAPATEAPLTPAPAADATAAPMAPALAPESTSQSEAAATTQSDSATSAEAAPISLPPLSAEALELIGGNSEKKSRTRRGGRRKSNNNTNKQ